MATIFAQKIVAQKIEPISSNEQSLFWRIPMTQRISWMQQVFETPEGMDRPLAFLPDTLHAGERFDLYFTCDRDMGEATFELYRIEGNRKKRILRKNFAPGEKGVSSFGIMLWVTIDEPGKYEIRAYQNAWLMELASNSKDENEGISVIEIEVLPQPESPNPKTP